MKTHDPQIRTFSDRLFAHPLPEEYSYEGARSLRISKGASKPTDDNYPFALFKSDVDMERCHRMRPDDPRLPPSDM